MICNSWAASPALPIFLGANRNSEEETMLSPWVRIVTFKHETITTADYNQHCLIKATLTMEINFLLWYSDIVGRDRGDIAMFDFLWLLYVCQWSLISLSAHLKGECPTLLLKKAELAQETVAFLFDFKVIPVAVKLRSIHHSKNPFLKSAHIIFYYVYCSHYVCLTRSR